MYISTLILLLGKCYIKHAVVVFEDTVLADSV